MRPQFFPRTKNLYFFKKYKDKLIVKSCSNVRSIVVNEKIFQDWDFKNIENLPTFFQEKIDGYDLRVHICRKKIWPLQVVTKDEIDYRYATSASVSYTKVNLPHYVKKLCNDIAKEEKNSFLGIDFMKNENSYYCLESNPGPGWSTYKLPSKNIFANQIIKQLTKKNYEKKINFNSSINVVDNE